MYNRVPPHLALQVEISQSFYVKDTKVSSEPEPSEPGPDMLLKLAMWFALK